VARGLLRSRGMERIKRIVTTCCLLAATQFGLPGPVAQAAPRAPVFAAAVVLEGTININTASAEQLAMLPGIGPTTAERILRYRARHPFKKAIHLMRVKGIGRKKFAKVKPYVRVEGETTLRPATGGAPEAAGAGGAASFVSDPRH